MVFFLHAEIEVLVFGELVVEFVDYDGVSQDSLVEDMEIFLSDSLFFLSSLDEEDEFLVFFLSFFEDFDVFFHVVDS